MNKITNQFSTIEQITDKYLAGSGKMNKETPGGISFEEIFRQKTEQTLKFSKHATMRLMDRNIQLSAEQSERLESGVTKAREKGIHESLVMVDSLAFIVNVPSKTVVTAMDGQESDRHVFTNIDGAVIA